MVGEKQITIKKVEVRDGYNPAEVYSCLVDLKDGALDENELKMLDRIATKYGQLNGKQLEELSHAEAPYIATELRQEIPYELAFYRGTDFSDL